MKLVPIPVGAGSHCWETAEQYGVREGREGVDGEQGDGGTGEQAYEEGKDDSRGCCCIWNPPSLAAEADMALLRSAPAK